MTNVSDNDKAEAVSPFLHVKRIIYKDNDDGMMWGVKSISVAPILDDTHHLDQTDLHPIAMAGRLDAG